jgi:hypothetical protein
LCGAPRRRQGAEEEHHQGEAEARAEHLGGAEGLVRSTKVRPRSRAEHQGEAKEDHRGEAEEPRRTTTEGDAGAKEWEHCRG